MAPGGRLLPRAPHAGLIPRSFLLHSPQALLPDLRAWSNIQTLALCLISVLPLTSWTCRLGSWLCRLPRAGFKRWFSLSSHHHHRFFSGGLQGARPGIKAYYSLKNQVSTVVLVGPAVPIYPNLQLMLDMTALAGWVSPGLASPCPFPAPWLVNSPAITGSSYLNEGENSVLFFSGAEFPSSEIMYY